MLLKLFRKAEIDNIEICERRRVFHASFQFVKEDAPDYNYFADIINIVPIRDKIEIMLEDDAGYLCNITAGNQKTYEDYISDCLCDSVISTYIRIDKEIADNHFSIYAFEEFAKDLLSIPVETVMFFFSKLFKSSAGHLIFDIYGNAPMFATKTMLFVPFGSEKIITDFDRNQRLDDCKKMSYFYNLDVYELIPDDFAITVDYENNLLTRLFQKIISLLSLCFIGTFSSINNGQVRGIVHGKQVIEFCSDTNQFSANENLYKIYNWIYTDGIPSDKAKIARNIISLYCKDISNEKLGKSILPLIQSEYDLYLRIVMPCLMEPPFKIILDVL